MSPHDRWWQVLLLALSLVLPGCSGCANYRRCNAPPPTLLAALPARLSDTGLFARGTAGVLAPGVRAYEPAFALWSDGADKQRWISLPEGARIDTRDPDDWSFPVGTKLWKQFSLSGRRLETRLLVRTGPGDADWAGAAYVWDAEQRDATLTPEGVKNVAGIGYDIPSAAECGGCHGGRRSHVLGFSALQLATPGLPLTLAELTREDLLSRPIPSVPALGGDELERSALGYLHANCGHCHNPERPSRGAGPRCYDPERSLNFWMSIAPPDSDAELPAVTSSVPRFVTPGDPEDSRLMTLVSRRGGLLHMPPLGSRHVDAVGVETLRAWIQSLKKER